MIHNAFDVKVRLVETIDSIKLYMINIIPGFVVEKKAVRYKKQNFIV